MLKWAQHTYKEFFSAPQLLYTKLSLLASTCSRPGSASGNLHSSMPTRVHLWWSLGTGDKLSFGFRLISQAPTLSSFHLSPYKLQERKELHSLWVGHHCDAICLCFFYFCPNLIRSQLPTSYHRTLSQRPQCLDLPVAAVTAYWYMVFHFSTCNFPQNFDSNLTTCFLLTDCICSKCWILLPQNPTVNSFDSWRHPQKNRLGRGYTPVDFATTMPTLRKLWNLQSTPLVNFWTWRCQCGQICVASSRSQPQWTSHS